MKGIIFSLLICSHILAQDLTSDLVICMPMDGNANDLSGNNNNGLVYNVTPTSDRHGLAGKAYYFNGLNSYIVINNSTTINMDDDQDFTVAFWVKAKATTNSDMAILTKHIAGTWNGFMFLGKNTNSGYCTSTNNLTFYVAAGAQEDACANNGVFSDTTNWYFITGVHDAMQNNTYIYINGQQQADVGGKSGSSLNTANLVLGSIFINSSYTSFFKGYLDELKIYRRALTNTEILTLYNTSSICNITGLREINTKNAFVLAPNPAQQNVYINCNEKSFSNRRFQVSVFSNDGRLVKKEEIVTNLNTNFAINIENLASGFYHVSISNDEYSQNLKFIKN